jgi:hypothetical protein
MEFRLQHVKDYFATKSDIVDMYVFLCLDRYTFIKGHFITNYGVMGTNDAHLGQLVNVGCFARAVN